MILKLQRINLLAVLLIFIAASCQQAEKTVDRQPNFIIIFADDMGYGDVASYGHPTIRTTNLDRMASQGQKWTNFYTAASVCTPSRAGLLTGRLPIRSGMVSNKKRVLFPDSKGGLPQSENTIAKLLKQADYKTACIGKWHLGHLPEFLPTSHGFDSYFGIPYSNDMDRIGGAGYIEACKNPEGENFNVPLMRDEDIIERPAFQPTIIQRYTSETVRFIEENQKDPFFIYLAHNMPHVPLYPSDQFKGKSERGIYGDVIEEIDWSVGQILESLERTGLDKNTMVIFTSDNGPWLMFQEHGGSAGLLRDGKGSTFDGGMRVPSLFYWNGTIKPAMVIDNGTTMDLLPTICSLAGVKLPNDRKYDGYDLSPVLLSLGYDDSLNVAFDEDLTYEVTCYIAGIAYVLAGTYIQEKSSEGDIWDITLNQTSFNGAAAELTSQGIFEVYAASPDSMWYEVAQTNPEIAGITAPTAAAGFGSTSGGAFGLTNIQKYLKQ